MTWEEIPRIKDVTGGYYGFKVGVKGLSLSTRLYRELKDLGWKYVRIEYDPDTWVVRVSEDAKGHTVGHHSVTTMISKHLPLKRFIYKTRNKKYLYFAKET